MLSLNSECLDRMLYFREAPLLKALIEFESQYHEERNHQRLKNHLIDPDDDIGETTTKLIVVNVSVDCSARITAELPETPHYETVAAVPLSFATWRMSQSWCVPITRNVV